MLTRAERGLWAGLASRRALVRLPDGRPGQLLFVAPKSGRAKVLVGGRHVRIAAADLEVIADPADVIEEEPTLRQP